MNYLFIIEEHYQFYKGFQDIFLNNHTILYYNKYFDTYDTLIHSVSKIQHDKKIHAVLLWGDYNSSQTFRLLYRETPCILSDVMLKDPFLKSWDVFLNFLQTIEMDVFLIGYGYSIQKNWEYIINKTKNLYISNNNNIGLFTFNNIDYTQKLFNYKINDIDLELFAEKPKLYVNSGIHLPSEIVYWGNDVINNNIKDYHNDIISFSKNNLGIVYLDTFGKVFSSIGAHEHLKIFVSELTNITKIYCNELSFLFIDKNNNFYTWHNCKNHSDYIEPDYSKLINNDPIKCVVYTDASFAILFNSDNLLTWGISVMGGGSFKNYIRCVYTNEQTIVALDYNGILSVFGIDCLEHHYPDISNTTKFYEIIPFKRGFLCKYDKNESLLFPYYNIVLKNEQNILIDIIKVVSNNKITFFLNKMGFVYKLDENYEFSIIGQRFINIFMYNGDLIGIQDDLVLFRNNNRIEEIKVLDIIICGNSSLYFINDKQQLYKYGEQIYGHIQAKYPYKIVKNNYAICIVQDDKNIKLLGNLLYGGIFNNKLINVISGFYDSIPYYNGFFGFRDISNMSTENDINLKMLENPVLSNRFCKNKCIIEDTLIIPYTGVNIDLYSYELGNQFYICNNGYHFITLNNITFLITDIGIYSKNSIGIFQKYDYFNTDVSQYKLINNLFMCVFVDTFPFDIEFEILTVPEYSEPNTSVGFFITSDNNVNKEFKYHILNKDSIVNRFYIDGNVLKIVNGLSDKLSENINHKLIIKTEDNNGFGYIKTFDFKLKISSLINNNICIEISNNIFYKNRYIIGELTINVKTVYNEYNYKLTNDFKSDNDMFDIINNRILIIKRGLIYDKMEYNICVKAIHSFSNTIVGPSVLNLRYIQLNDYQAGISLTNTAINEKSLDLYVGTFMYITNKTLKDNQKFILESHHDIFSIKSKNQLFLNKYAMYLLEDSYKLKVTAIEIGATAFLDVFVNRDNKLSLDLSLEHSQYLHHSNIYIVGQISVLNNHNNYSLQLYDYIDGEKINNNNNNFYIKDNHVYISNLQIIGNQEIIIRCNIDNSALFTSKKFIIKNELCDYFFDISSTQFKEASDNLIVAIINSFYRNEHINDDSYMYKLISHINSININSDNSDFEIINNNQIKINYIPYISNKTNYEIFIGQFYKDKLTFYRKYELQITPSEYRPQELLLSSNIIYRDITFIGIISIVDIPSDEYIFTTNSNYFEVIENQIFKKPGFISDNNIDEYKIIVKCTYKNNSNLWCMKEFNLVCEKIRCVSNISYTSSVKLYDIILSNNIINLDSNDLCIGYLQTKSDNDYQFTYSIGNTHDYAMFEIIDGCILKLRNFNLAKGKLQLYLPILSYINSNEFIEKILTIQIMSNGNILEIKTPRNIKLTNNAIEHKTDNHIIGLLNTVDDETNEYIYNLQDTIQDIQQYNNNDDFEIINDNQLRIKHIPNYYNKDRYTIIVRARRIDYPDIFIDKFLYIYVIKPFTPFETVEHSALYPDTIVLSNNYINKNSNYIGYFKVLSNGIELENFKFTIYEKDTHLMYLNYFEILNENQLIFHNISGMELKNNYKISVVAHHNDIFFEKDFIISSDYNYGYKIRVNELTDYIIKLNYHCHVDTYIGVIDIYPANTEWSLSASENFSIIDNKLYIKNENYKLDNNFTIFGKTKNGQDLEIDNKFTYTLIEPEHEIDISCKKANLLIYEDPAYILFQTNNCDYYLEYIQNENITILQGSINLENNRIQLSNNNLVELIPKKLGNYVIEFIVYDNNNTQINNLHIFITNSSKSEIINYNTNVANMKILDHFKFITSNPMCNSIDVSVNRGLFKNDTTYTSISDGFKCVYNHIYNAEIPNIDEMVVILECFYIGQMPCIFFDIMDSTYTSIVHKLNCKLLLNMPEFMGIDFVLVNRLSLISDEYIDYAEKIFRLIPSPKNTQFIFNAKVSGLYTFQK